MGRSISSHFRTRVVAPVVCLVLLWGVLAGTAITGTLNRLRWLASMSSSQQLRIESGAVAGAALVVIIATLVLMGSFSRRMAREISGLTAVVEEIHAGELAAEDRWPATNITEIAIAGAALASLNRSAAAATSAESALRHGLRQILVSLAKRNQALLHRQLRIIDDLEQQANSPAALADLFTLDHLTTRMRRNAESLTILSGAVPSRSWSGPVPVIDVMRAAAAEVEDYTRVTVISDSGESVMASAVTDMIHLLAELIENATVCSPSTTRVEVRAERVANGFAIEIEDRGLGIPADQLREINEQLGNPPDFDQADPDRLGLFVAGKLAARHGVHVSLNQSPYLGIRAVVVMPEAILDMSVSDGGESPAGARPSGGRLSKLNMRAAEVLALAGAVSPDPGAPGPAATTRNGLPRRVRPESPPASPASPASQAEPSAATGPAATGPAVGPAPEEARSLAASLQSSWQRSRQADPAPGAAPGAELPGASEGEGE